MKSPDFEAERELWKQHHENTELSYRVMCEAHAQLIEREKIYVRTASDLNVALLTIFHETKDPASRAVAAAALNIKMPIPFPKKPSSPKKKTSKKTWRPGPGQYKGSYLQATRSAMTKAEKSMEMGHIMLAIGDRDPNGWIPVLFQGRRDDVLSGNIKRIGPDEPKKLAGKKKR